MTLFDAISIRKSVRTYSGEALTPDLMTKIKEYAASAPQLEQVKGDSEAKMMSIDGTLRAPGTYGFISGARNYLVLLRSESQIAALNAGYYFEHVVLYCTSLGLGTCWLGGTFKRSDFAKQIDVPADKIIDIVLPVGQAAEKMRLRDKLLKSFAGSAKRKPFGEMFFADGFSAPLSEDSKFGAELEAVRIAPSAVNKQPWRVSVDGDKVRFYCDGIEKEFGAINMGIAMCHFEVACQHYGIGGEWVIEHDAPGGKNFDYTITFLVK
jgi:nitroreductase